MLALTDLVKKATGVADDSRKVKKGFVFVAVPGLTHDGHNFIGQAIKKGAIAVVGERDLKLKVPYVKVKNSRLALAQLAAAWYGYPAKKLKLIGVTGSKGKTSVTTLIWWILNQSNRKAGLVSSVSAKIGNREYDTGLHVTNPEPLVLQDFLAKMVDAGCEYAVLEVTSHGLDQERVGNLDFGIGVLTNIEKEHLDYHGTLKRYIAAKKKLFQCSKLAIINQRHDVFPKLGVKKIYYSADDFQRENIAAARTVARQLGVTEKKIVQAIKSFPGIPGRMEEVKNRKGIKIIIDFAHTPGSLEAALKEVKKQTKGKLICVFGCAGERDRQKRPTMGEVSGELADMTVITAEDPRGENVYQIMAEIEKGMERVKGRYFKIAERGEAIHLAIDKLAQKGDTVVICGKGHEKSMAYSEVEYSWSDHEAVQMALAGKTKVIKRPKKAAVIGLGIEGKDLVNFLTKKGYKITVFDQKKESELDFIGVDQKGFELITGQQYLKRDFSDFELVCRSPGVRPFSPRLTSAIRLFFDQCPAKIIGITGTKGKGTTSTLIYQIMKKAGLDVYLAGNIGKPYLKLLPKLTVDSWVLLEMSSFQLIDMEKSPNIAVVLNITADHLDWHKSRKEYVNAKENIVCHQLKDDFSVINADYSTPKSFAKETAAKVIYFAKKSLPRKYKKATLLRGEHNWENIAAVVTAAKILAISDRIILDVLRHFKGLEHRLELVGKKQGVTFYNDSFATGPQPTIAAIKSFSEPLTIILGGSEKGLNYDELAQVVSQSSVAKVILIGEVRNKIKTSLEKANFKGKILDLGRSKMDKIIQVALENTPQGGVVLLSPAAASFDMFTDYKDRGNQFKRVMREIVR